MATTKAKRLGQYVEDPEYAAKQRVFHKHTSDRLASFTAFDPAINVTYTNNWLSKIQEFEAHPSDETMFYGIEAATDEITEQRKRMIAAMRELEFYVKRAFPNNEYKLREFGFYRLSATRDVVRLGVTCFVTKRIANEYLTELTAAGMPLTVLTNLETQLNALYDTEAEQEYQKRLRIRATEQRIGLHNLLYTIYNRVRDAAYIVFRGNPELTQMWDLT